MIHFYNRMNDNSNMKININTHIFTSCLCAKTTPIGSDEGVAE